MKSPTLEDWLRLIPWGAGPHYMIALNCINLKTWHRWFSGWNEPGIVDNDVKRPLTDDERAIYEQALVLASADDK